MKIINILILFFLPLIAGAQISGVVFRDLNANGVKDNTTAINEPFVGGITVTAYDALGNVQTTTSNATTGAYSFSGLTLPVRIEFSGYDTGEYSGPVGTANRSSVQFYSAATTTANFGINYPDDYCQTNPKITFNRYENGSGVGNTQIVLNQIDYNDTGSGQNENFTGATADVVGTVFGVATDRNTKLAYYSAFLKRQAGIGDRGYDGIYVVNMATNPPAVVGGFDLQGVVPSNGGAALDFGTVTRNLIASGNGTGVNDLSANRTAPSRDADAFGKVGKIAYGDIDIDNATQTIWGVNLFERSIVAIDISANLHTTSNPNTIAGAKVRRYFMVSGSPLISGMPTCSNGNMRPFGIKFYQGRVYVGVVCDGSSLTQVDMTANQMAYVLSFDAANPTSFTTEVSFPLNYNRERSWIPFNETTTFDALESDNWQRWVDTYTDPTSFGSGVNSTNQDIKTGLNGLFVGAPQPILSDIEINTRGDLILAFMDRFPHQQGWANYIPTTSSVSRSAVSHGDLLLAYNTGSGYSLEGPNENDNFSTPAVAANAQPGQELNDGPSGAGEFFYRDYYIGSDATHPETALGAVAYLPGKGEVVAMMFDPNSFNAQGIRWMSETTGNQTDYYTVVANTGISNFGKGAGLGDVELMCNAAPIEIGNRVWLDTDGDGVQDPNEAPIAGVSVELVKNGTVIAVATTDANGNYYFSNAMGTSSGSALYNLTQLVAGMTYTVRIPDATGTMQQSPLSGYVLTSADANGGTAGTQADVRDSDGTQSGNYAQVTFTTGPIGSNNHTYDFGFISNPVCSISVTASPSACDNATNQYSVSGTITFSNPPTSGTLTVSSAGVSQVFTAPFTSPQAYALNNINSDGVMHTVTAVFSANNTCTASVSYTAPTSCADVLCTSNQQFTWCPGESYTLTATIGLSGYQWYLNNNPISGANSNVYIAAGLGVYTWTATEFGGCPAIQCCPIELISGDCCTLNITCSVTQQPGCGLSNGSATVNITGAVGAVSIMWSSGEATATISGKDVGLYSVMVTDINCTKMCSVLLTNPSAPSADCSLVASPTCAMISGGSASVIASGGNASSYTYEWSNGNMTSSPTGLMGGTYTVTVTDGSNCMVTCDVDVPTPSGCCEIDLVTVTSFECLDNGTPNLMTDNRLRIGLLVTNADPSLMSYTVSVDGGTTITPNSGTYGSATLFTLGPGSGGSGATFTIIISDGNDSGCMDEIMVTSPMDCQPATNCPDPKCGTATIQVNGN